MVKPYKKNMPTEVDIRNLQWTFAIVSSFCGKKIDRGGGEGREQYIVYCLVF